MSANKKTQTKITRSDKILLNICEIINNHFYQPRFAIDKIENILTKYYKKPIHNRITDLKKSESYDESIFILSFC